MAYTRRKSRWSGKARRSTHSSRPRHGARVASQQRPIPRAGDTSVSQKPGACQQNQTPRPKETCRRDASRNIINQGKTLPMS